MAALGHTARVTIGAADLTSSIEAWQQLEFDVTDQGDGWAHLSDGQVLLRVVHNGPSVMTLTYEQSHELGSATAQILPSLGIQHLQRPSTLAERRTGARNAALGYVDAMVIPSENPRQDREVLEQHGFFVVEEWGGAYQQSDVTDGMITLSLATHARSPYLLYRQELTTEVVEDLASLDGITCDVHIAADAADDGVSYVRLTMPDGARVVVLHDANYE